MLNFVYKSYSAGSDESNDIIRITWNLFVKKVAGDIYFGLYGRNLNQWEGWKPVTY